MRMFAGPEALRSRVAIVTEGSHGLGRQVALRLAEDGFDIVIAYTVDRVAAENTSAAIEAKAGRAFAVEADVADEPAVARLFQRAEEAFGTVDVVVNSAEVVVSGSVATLAPGEFERMYRTNVLGAFVVSRCAARSVRRGGALINISSCVSMPSGIDYGAYTAGKAAVNALTLLLTAELRERNVTVNAVASHSFTGNPASPDHIQELADIAETIAYLAGPGHWVNGQILYAG